MMGFAFSPVEKERDVSATQGHQREASWPGLKLLSKPLTIKRRITRRLRNDGLMCYLLGLLLRRRFQRAGLIGVYGGWPFPHVENLGGRIEVESCGFYPGSRLECWRGAVIRIGHGTYLNRGVEIVAAESVTIGRDCKIARDVIIMDTDQHAIPGAALVAKPVTIGDRVWIGARAIILKGVEIGSDSIIGAGAVITKSVPPGSVVVGPEARAVRVLQGGDRAQSVRAVHETPVDESAARLTKRSAFTTCPQAGDTPWPLRS